MEFKYPCQAEIQRILDRIKPIPDHFKVSADYLYGLDNESFVEGFYRLRFILINIYRDMQARPEEYKLMPNTMSVPVTSHFPEELISLDYYPLMEVIPDESVSVEFSVYLNEKQRKLLLDLLSDVPKDYVEVCKELIEHTVSFGYLPYQTKANSFAVSFVNKKTGSTILKLQSNKGLNFKKNVPRLFLKFFANKTYSDVFTHAVKITIEKNNGKYNGCFGCGKNCGELMGYTYTYPDGRSVFRCGSEMVQIPNWSKENLSEILELIRLQAEFFGFKNEEHS